MPGAIFFDLDGTLHDRTATLRAWLPHHQARFGLPDSYAARFLELDDFGYRSKREVMPLLAEEFGLQCEPELMFTDFWTHLDHAQAMPHSAAVLTELRRRGVKIGVVTNGWEETQTRCLRGCGLTDLADDVVISRAVGLSKPDPRIYYLALKRLGVTAAQSWFVGDSPRNDVWGPGQVGLRTAYLPTGHPLNGERPDVTLSDLRGVLDLP
ncbi:HAD family hydrolase [Deinococcus wulumuqiensis]